MLKIEMPDDLGGHFEHGINVLEMADGHGYAKLYAYDLERRACLLERLGKPVSRMGYPVRQQLEIICATLQKAWEIPAGGRALTSGEESIAWFRRFIGEAWERLGRPCPRGVIVQAFRFLQARENAWDPAGFVPLHGDAHGGDTLENRQGGGFKLIDPDGLYYEKAYDLGVLMREWPDEYGQNPLTAGRERCRCLHRLTGVSEQAIWEWGYLQTVSTAFVFLQTGQKEAGEKLLRLAGAWCGGDFR